MDQSFYTADAISPKNSNGAIRNSPRLTNPEVSDISVYIPRKVPGETYMNITARSPIMNSIKKRKLKVKKAFYETDINWQVPLSQRPNHK